MQHQNVDSQQAQPPKPAVHPIGVYFKIWFLLFLLSALSYTVDYMQLQGMLRWGLIIVFMVLKAGLIVAVFMHMMWERLALIYAMILPPLAILVLVLLMHFESSYTLWNRISHFSGG